MASHLSKLEIRSVSGLTGRFRIPSYQRGYRWERRHVRQLLDDLLEHTEDNKSGDPYYLQPIVVAPVCQDGSDDRMLYDYDLIDGQQRLTTILIVLRALDVFKAEHPDRKQLAGLDFSAGYSITYATRPDSADFLAKVHLEEALWGGEIRKLTDIAVEYPDFLYMWHACQEAKDWIGEHDEDLTRLGRTLLNDVKIIWYELNETVESWEKFTQLNVGKIPLTNSELVKAMLLSDQHQDIDDYGRSIVVNQWDSVERELSDRRFYSFLTTSAPSEPRIDFIFDLFAGKPAGNRDEFYTFQYFMDKSAPGHDGGALPRLKGKELWDDIYLKYLRLRDWYNDSWYYHRIGYLVATDRTGSALRSIFTYAYPDGATEKSKSEVRTEIDRRVRESLVWDGVSSIWNLSYDDPDSEEYSKKSGRPHNPKIISLLTLYNVMIYDELNARYGIRYPFWSHNSVSGGWSLEHIHAQHSERLTHADKWKEWVADHLDSLRRIRKFLNIDRSGDSVMIAEWDALDVCMSGFAVAPDGDRFDEIVKSFSALTAASDPRTSGEYKDELTNMALLSRDSNSRLNNSTFDVKRVIVSEYVSRDFVPLGTERVFLKSISDEFVRTDGSVRKYSCDVDHVYYWGEKDRTAYRYDIWNRLKPYLPASDNPEKTNVESSDNDDHE